MRYTRVISYFVLALADRREVSEEEFVNVYGAGGSRQFWENYLFGIVPIGNLIHTLEILGAPEWEKTEIHKLALEAAFLEAYQCDEKWFRGRHENLNDVVYLRHVKDQQHIKVIGRQAVDWLARNPRWRHLIPPTLAQFLASDGIVVTSTIENAGATAAAGGAQTPKRRGPKPDKREATAQRMRDWLLQDGANTHNILRSMKEEALASIFGASRDTCRKARTDVLSQFPAT